MEDHQLSQKKTVQLVNAFTTEYTHAEVKCYLSMVEHGQQISEGLTTSNTYLPICRKCSTLIAHFFSQTQKGKESEETFADSLQVPVQKIIS